MKKSGAKLLLFCLAFLASLIYSYFNEPGEAVKSVASESAVAERVVDGDTVILANGAKLRYIGIDTPETKDPRRAVGCFGKEASIKNKEIVEGKEVRLEKDVSETDKYGRLLRYVWVGELFVNEYLVKNGFAQVSTYPPDVRYQDVFRQAEVYARDNNLGLWSACPLE